MEHAFGTAPRTVAGFDDDISAIKALGNKLVVLKTDMLVGSTDIPPGMTMKQAARKAVVANISDLAAKGVRPSAGLVALGLQPRLTRRDIQEIASGLSGAAKDYGFPIIGGDTNESKDLTISIMLFAIADKRRLILRSGARVGDIVAVTGEFGAASAGLTALLKEHLPVNSLSPALSRAVYRPRAELDVGVALGASGTLTASIDSSDGLAWSLHQLSQASNVGIEVNHVPVSKAAREFAIRFHYKANDLALYGGEEYNLIVTVKPSKFQLARKVARGRLFSIGVVTRKSDGVRLRQAEGYSEIPMKGWEHFRRQA
jgi:thiamine-monophosphate kinase